jgi:23S rRNA (uracil1939-C5)-methyltransferase
MSRKKSELPIYENITITDVAAEGKCIARVNDMVIFVPFVVPGDVVDLQVTHKKHHYCEAVVKEFRAYSPNREIAFCSHFGTCGGCKWQILPYEAQLRYKQQQVVDNLTRIGKVALPEISPTIGSEKTRCYRNKLEFGFSSKRWLTKEDILSGKDFSNENNVVGFHPTGSFDKILSIEKCWLMDDICNTIRNGVRDFALERGFSFHDQRAHKGLMRNLMIRTSNTGEILLLFQFCIFTEEEHSQANEVMEYVAKTFPEVTCITYVNNTKFNDTMSDLEVQTYKGKGYIFLEMENLRFKVQSKSFYQTNTDQAYNLYKVVRNFASLTGKELVYDLYTGTGTIADFLAGKAQKVIGIEYVPEAIEDAKENSQINGIQNTLFFAGDMKDLLTNDFIQKYGRPDVIITDPPRVGMHPDVVNVILSAEPKCIVYVSCNPATQARDLALLDAKYKIVAVQPVDMFPQTQHVENVVKLELK